MPASDILPNASSTLAGVGPPWKHRNMPKRSPYGPQMTFPEKRQMLKDRFHLLIGPLVLCLAVSGASSEPSSVFLAWTVGTALVALVLNRLIP